MSIKTPKKLIEVSLPLEDINEESAREKSIRHGHPSTLHLWWARRPLAAARAVLFAQLVNDPGGERGYKSGLTKDQAAKKRERLFDIIRDLVKWENVNNEMVLNQAREEIRRSWLETCEMNKGKPGFDPDKMPAFHDPFAGGGAIPLEAQRLGLESYASDLNPVAVLINKAMIEIPPAFANMKPVGPVPEDEKESDLVERQYIGAQGLAEDVRRYGLWMREEAKKRIGNLYPEIEVTKAMVKKRPDLAPYLGQKLTVFAWIWARTVKSPNPKYSHVDVPLVSSFIVSKKKGKEAYVQPVIKGDQYHFEVKAGTPPKDAENGTKMARGANFRCLMSDVPIDDKYIKNESMEGRMKEKLMAIVCEGNNRRIYLSPTPEQEELALNAKPKYRPEQKMNRDTTNLVSGRGYGFYVWGDLFTSRQLTALNAFSELIGEARKKVIADAKAAGMSDDGKGLEDGGSGATAYGDAIAVYLAFAVDKGADLWSTIATWIPQLEAIRNTFARQAIPMVWDYAESNMFSNSSGCWNNIISWIYNVIVNFDTSGKGFAVQSDAQTQTVSNNKIVSTDPPYYDNIGYADLSDFFYVWLRKNMKPIFPSLFASMAVPKEEELVATPYRHGSKEAAESFFLNGMTDAMRNLASQIHPAFPITIYYAYKASETNDDGVSNTGWETFLEALIKAGFVVTGTWPMRTERSVRTISIGANALASSIVLVCRRRDENAKSVSRREYRSELDNALSDAIEEMYSSKRGAALSRLDLNQAAIGPGMEIFSKYKSILKPDGTPLTVHEAVIDINNAITRFLNPDEESLDPITNFCKAWFEQYSWEVGKYDDAEKLARSKQTTVDHVRDSGVAIAKGGKVQLLRWQDYPTNYVPEKDKSCSAWETCHHLIRLLNTEGELAAARLMKKLSQYAQDAFLLADYMLNLCKQFNMEEDAGYYNDLITNWRRLLERADDDSSDEDQQQRLF